MEPLPDSNRKCPKCGALIPPGSKGCWSCARQKENSATQPSSNNPINSQRSRESLVVFLKLIGGLAFLVLIAQLLRLDEHFDDNVSRSVSRCLESIEARNWDDYCTAFEPSAVIQRRSPALPVHFAKIQTSVIAKLSTSATIRLSMLVNTESVNSSWPVLLDLTVVKVERGDFLGHFGLKRWYLSADEIKQLPFDYLK